MFFNDTATTEIYTYLPTLSLHDALPISRLVVLAVSSVLLTIRILFGLFGNALRARKLRRLGFSHIGRVKADGKAHAISLCKAAPSDSGGQQAEPMAARAPSVSSPAITPHVEPEMPIGLGGPRREKLDRKSKRMYSSH